MDNEELHLWIMRQHAQKHRSGATIDNPQRYVQVCDQCRRVVTAAIHLASVLSDD